ncbi:transcription elongation factor SPT4-like [Tropilaelaps mercedesae]|uniref:Transcription elongation factor SPT4 n=1 Tax=Tropilaelaps mercedesae TaxID=418985 RepID=A0A1V9XSH5_9ACAR|nr:transcription elongation factor SPT4-like [Tropilaelaps mercedesae]
MTASMDHIPKDLRNLRACMLCSLVKSVDQFEDSGCQNCESLLQMKSNREQVLSCTSTNFSGFIVLMHPEDSWVAKWQRSLNRLPGAYAVSVSGRLPAGMVRELKRRGVTYRSRDTSEG